MLSGTPYAVRAVSPSHHVSFPLWADVEGQAQMGGGGGLESPLAVRHLTCISQV